jgi:competence protein ComEA
MMTFQAVCGACHPTTLASGIRSESEWKETIDQMVSLGAEVTEELFERVLRYLLRTRTRVNVNSATAAEIAAILDISVATAATLVKFRTNKGSFKTLEELKRVPGIDAAALETKKDRVAF